MTTTRPTIPVEDDVGSSGMWISRLRRAWLSKLPPEKLLPDRQPAYVSSWIYVFGVLTIAAFFVIVVSGLLLVVGGPAWYHTSSLGRFSNSLHFWSGQLFFIFMVVHLWGKFWMAAWRGRRATTWMTGVVAFLASIGTAFTGYLATDQPRLTVDLVRSEGWAQRRRHRRLFQRHKPRPNDAAARDSAAFGRRRHPDMARCCSSGGEESSHRSMPDPRVPRRAVATTTEPES